MALDISSARAACSRCGTEYSRRKGFFPVSYCELYKGSGYLHVCKSCIDKMYDSYLAQCNDPKTAVRQVCRKLDLYWGENVYDIVVKKNTPKTMMTAYIARLNTVPYTGKSYDDTLSKEGTLWSFADAARTNEKQSVVAATLPEDEQEDTVAEISQDVIDFWGDGYSTKVYQYLEKRYNYYISRLPDGTNVDVGAEILLKQVCITEYDISRCVAEGKSTDKLNKTLNDALDGLHLKPKQNKQDEVMDVLTSTPLGVWLDKYEHFRPLPETDESLKRQRGIMKYVFIWLGHVLEMLGKQNPYHDIYAEEMDRLRVDPPVYDGDDDTYEEDESDGDTS